MENLTGARATTTFVQRLQQLGKFDLLILEDWGIEPIAQRAENDLLELIDSRPGKRPLLITSQMPMNIWHDTFHNKEAIADALMDRIIHGSYHIQLSGESLRKVQASRRCARRRNNLVASGRQGRWRNREQCFESLTIVSVPSRAGISMLQWYADCRVPIHCC